jgi:hypothetical protein
MNLKSRIFMQIPQRRLVQLSTLDQECHTAFVEEEFETYSTRTEFDA